MAAEEIIVIFRWNLNNSQVPPSVIRLCAPVLANSQNEQGQISGGDLEGMDRVIQWRQGKAATILRVDRMRRGRAATGQRVL
jgi:hypothetical protein